MNYEILTSRWTCQDCGAPLRLHFSQNGSVEDDVEAEFVCDRVTCVSGHPVPDEIAQDALENADQEFYAALERGCRVAEVWQAPAAEETPSEMPPEE